MLLSQFSSRQSWLMQILLVIVVGCFVQFEIHFAEAQELLDVLVHFRVRKLGDNGRKLGLPDGGLMRNLHPHRLAGDLHILVAPVELVSLPRLEGHRDERRCAFARILPPRSTPARRAARQRAA